MITVEINGYDVKRVLIDLGSSTNVVFLEELKQMGKSEKDPKKVNFPLMSRDSPNFSIWSYHSVWA